MLWKRQATKQGKNRKTYNTSSVITTKFLSQDIDADNTWHYTTFLQEVTETGTLKYWPLPLYYLESLEEKDIALSDDNLPSQHKQI